MPRKKDQRHKQIGGKHRASSRYAMIKHRIANTNTSRNKSYAGVELKITQEDFIEWFMSRDFEGCSVDRIDSNGHYDISNIRLIPLGANIAKEKLKAKGGKSSCYRCKKEKPLDEFVTDNSRLTVKKTTICKACDYQRKLKPNSIETPEKRAKRLQCMKDYYQRKKRSSGK